MMFFRRIYSSSTLIDKDVKIREKFHQKQLFALRFPRPEPAYLHCFNTRSARSRLNERALASEEVYVDRAREYRFRSLFATAHR
jgi:hypothetical protein